VLTSLVYRKEAVMAKKQPKMNISIDGVRYSFEPDASVPAWLMFVLVAALLGVAAWAMRLLFATA
jgi:hypothetical protein